MRVIGLHGKARSGKDEVADILHKAFGFTKCSFAKRVKELGIRYFQLTEDECFGSKTKESRMILQGIGNSVRENCFIVKEMMQAGKTGISTYPLWTEALAIHEFNVDEKDLSSKRKKIVRGILNGIYEMYTKHLEEFFDVSQGNPKDYWVSYLFNLLDEEAVYVIQDVRYENEYIKLSLIGGKRIHIIRVDAPEIEFGANHESEVQLDGMLDWDFVIYNTHDKDWRTSLSQQVSNMVRKVNSTNFFLPSDIDKFNANI